MKSNIVFDEMDATTLHERLLEAVAAIFPGHGPSMEDIGLDYFSMSLESVEQFQEIQAEVEEAGVMEAQGFRRFKKRREWREAEWAYSRDLEFMLALKGANEKRGLPIKLCGLVVGLSFGLLRSLAAHYNIELNADHLHEWQRELFGSSVPKTVESNYRSRCRVRARSTKATCRTSPHSSPSIRDSLAVSCISVPFKRVGGD